MALMVEPTDRMMDLFDAYNARLTIMADVSEIGKFKEHHETTGIDSFHYESISRQLQRAVKTGHDVQLHLHPSYDKARYLNGCWLQNYEEYNLATLKLKRLDEIIKSGISLLNEMLETANPDYSCIAFRAANWSMQPSDNIIEALIKNRIKYDTSVFKYGRHDGLVNFNYDNAYSELFPWPVSAHEICEMDPDGKLIEVPIYCVKRSLPAFLSLNRLYRAISSWKHRAGKNVLENAPIDTTKTKSPSLPAKIINKASMLFKKHPWKMDFNQCTGSQLIRGLQNIEKRYGQDDVNLPVVLIGHSKIFTRSNEKSLQPFLAYIANNQARFQFGTFHDIESNNDKK